MEYSKQLLGKSIRDVSYEDIVTYFSTDRKENELLEFKSFAHKGSEAQNWDPMLKGVCAFLNSAGGVLIWGAPKGVPGPGKEKIFQGAPTGVDPTFEKDMIVNKISSSIIPLASDFKIELLKGQGGGQVCIIEINESQYKPHQFQHIYYMRLDGQSRAAPHYYVEALFKRVALPNLEGFLQFEEPRMQNDSRGFRYELMITVIIANFSSTQNEENIYYKITSNVARWWIESWNEKSNPKPENGMKNVVHTDVLSILANGNPFKRRYRFEFTDHEIKNTSELLFTLQFGGKKSPPKYSKYQLTFDKENKNLLETDKLENLSIGDDKTGEMSREAQLRAIFRR
jgi:hypothetical protein